MNKIEYDYNIVMIDTQHSSEVLRVLLNYGKDGYRFVGWTPNPQKSDKLPHLKEAIFEKFIIKNNKIENTTKVYKVKCVGCDLSIDSNSPQSPYDLCLSCMDSDDFK